MLSNMASNSSWGRSSKSYANRERSMFCGQTEYCITRRGLSAADIRTPAARSCRPPPQEAHSPRDGTALAYLLLPMRTTPIFRRPHRARCALLAFSLAPMLAAAQVAVLQDVAQLEAMARSQAALQFPKLTDRQRFVAGPIEAHSN